MIKKNKWIFLAVACIFAVIGGYTSFQKHELDQAQSHIVEDFFTISLSDSKGQRQSLMQWKGKTLLVNFWAPWCNPCVEEMPELSRLQTETIKQNIQIIGIGVDSAANISDFLLKHKIEYPIYIADTQGVELGRKFGNQAGGLPFTVLIDQTGHIKKSYLGRLKFEELKHDLGLP